MYCMQIWLFFFCKVYYTPAGQGYESTLSTNSTTSSITLSDLVPGVEYSINVTAVTTTGGRITSRTVTTTTCEFLLCQAFSFLSHSLLATTALFQIRILPVGDCLKWIVSVVYMCVCVLISLNSYGKIQIELRCNLAILDLSFRDANLYCSSVWS